MNNRNDGHGKESIAAALEQDGWLVRDGFLDESSWRGLAAICAADVAADGLHPAAVGRELARRIDPSLRGDRLRWFDAQSATPPERTLLARLDRLRQDLNRRLYLGLRSCEAHYACYQPGAHYSIHRDRFRDDDARVVSLVVYLNDAWRATDGGALRLYLEPRRSRYEDVLPVGGRLVAFLSAEFEHEVLPATRERMSIAAWLRRDASL